MDKQAFYDHLAQVISRPLSELEVKLLDIACEPDASDKRRLEYEMKEGIRNSTKGRIPEFIPLAEVPRRAAEGSYGYWLYDRKTKVWIIGMSNGTHEQLSGMLYGILSGTEDAAFSVEFNAENYIEENCGFFVSGSMNMYIPIKNEGCILTEEEQIFEHLKGKLRWRGI